MNKESKIIKMLIVIIILLVLSIILNKNTEEIDYELLSNKVSNKILSETRENGVIDYNKIELMIKESQSEQTELIKEYIDTNYDEIDKDFGTKFEEASSYFGGKIKETYDDISKEFKK